MSKKIIINKELDELKLKVVNEFETAVGSTLGPKGNCVLLEQYPGSAPKMTKDGVTVAKTIEYEDFGKNSIASYLKTAATNTVNEAGDGTSTSIILASNIFFNFFLFSKIVILRL